jgi:hypothetical protein
MSRSAARTAALALAIALATVGCGDDDDGTSPSAACTQDVGSIAIAPGATPRFTWTPGCGVNELVVRDVATSEVMWRIADTDGDDLIASGVNYGTVPAGASEEDGPFDLIEGRTYIVVLYRYAGTVP